MLPAFLCFLYVQTLFTLLGTIDYFPVSKSITIPAGETTATVKVTMQGNTLVEPGEFLKAVLTPCAGCDHVKVGNPGTAFIKIVDCTGEYFV